MICRTKSSRNSKAKKSGQTTRNEPAQSEMSQLERYVLESQRYEQIAVGEQYDGPSTEQQLQDFAQAWQAASESGK
ncbi:hypothetical protein GGS26DRAFT_544439 [Hypomontagnella submonticulosa]|nr:hypothetical protein GGS26DRAFT_544439 [Hypomontagnella submonticulosa]